MRLVLIVAMAMDRSIGCDNQLLWHLPKDLKRFRAITMGHTILMGRRTWDSLPHGALPHRRNVVVTRTEMSLPQAEVYTSINEALEALALEDVVYVIGGGEIYRQTLDRAEELHITLVRATYPHADTHFPDFDWSEWEILAQDDLTEQDIPATYYYLKRK